MTNKMIDVLVDAMALAFKGRHIQPIAGYVDDWIDFCIDLEGCVPCDKADELVNDIDEVREFCEFFNKKNIKEEDVDEAIANREALVYVVAEMIKNKDYERAFEALDF